jgi:putative ABC transport system permease protein
VKQRKVFEPPKWAQRFLSWYCRPELLEDLQGDLNEYFNRNLSTRGVRRARLNYMLDVLKFFRIYTIRKPEFINLLIHWIMIGSYIKTSSRSIVRNKLFSVINIFGLAVSMSVGLLMIAFISDLLSYDDFHEKRDRIYRVITTSQTANQPPMDLATTSVKAGQKIRETISGVEELTILRRGFGGDATIGETILPVSGLWADESFFNVFTFPLLQGDPATALKEPYSLVLTEQSAKKLIGITDALGKSVKFDTLNYVVTGVLKDIPKLSHMRFEALVSFSTVELQKPDTDGGFLSWESIYMNYVYIVLPKKSDPQTLQAHLDKLSREENASVNKTNLALSLQPLKEITIGNHVSNEMGPTMNIIALWILVGLAFIVILSACFNYTNLSIARSLRRSREVGIRKVIGASKSHVLGQFITESVIISLLSLVFSFLLFLLLRTQFLSLDNYLENLVSLALSPRIIFCFIALATIVGIVAGFLPALFFSRINAIRVLKDVSSLHLFRHVNMRKALIIVQYVFSLIFITTTVIGYKQYKSFLSFDLGFTTENILNIKLDGTSGDLLAKELSELPEINGISRSLIVMSLGSNYGEQMKYKNDSAGIWQNFVDEHYLPLHNHKFLAGKNFNAKTENAEESEVIVNEQILKRFEIEGKDPNKALGEEVIMGGKKLTIVGVVKDFHYETLEDKIEPMVFRYSTNKTYGYINAKITTKDWPATLSSIDRAWRKIDKVHPLDAKFYDDQIEEAYSQFSVMIKVIGFLAFLAVCIASIGLFGMVVFTTETRLKEISIRKVLGASEGKLIYLLSKGFLLLLTIAALIALPATYVFFDKVILINFAYHQPIELSELIIGVLIVMMLAFIMIGSQTLKVARSNPAEVLKNE